MKLFRSLSCLVFTTACLASADPKSTQPVDLHRLHSLISSADRLEVYSEGLRGEKPLFSSAKPEDRTDLIRAIQFDEKKEEPQCMCGGSPIIRLYRDGKLLVQVSNQHGDTVRCSLWSKDFLLTDPEAWLTWFDTRNIAGPRLEVRAAAERWKQEEIAQKRWNAAMPPCVHPLWETVMRSGGICQDITPFTEAMKKAYPDQTVRVRTLLAWYGSGAGPWTGFPAYEQVPESLLLQYSTASLVEAATQAPLNTQETEGLVRLFSLWNFENQRPGDLATIPSPLRKHLLGHAMSSTDEDKKARAFAALGK